MYGKLLNSLRFTISALATSLMLVTSTAYSSDSVLQTPTVSVPSGGLISGDIGWHTLVGKTASCSISYCNLVPQCLTEKIEGYVDAQAVPYIRRTLTGDLNADTGYLPYFGSSNTFFTRGTTVSFSFSGVRVDFTDNFWYASGGKSCGDSWK